MDRQARDTAAALLEAFVDHRITNDQLQDSWPESEDPALREIDRAVWLTYDDLEEHLGPRDGHELIKRCAAFLRSDEPYAWPQAPFWRSLLATNLSLFSLGLVRINDGGPTFDEPWPSKLR